MTLDVICPYCRFSKKVPIAAIPRGAKRAVCPRCSQRFDISLPGAGDDRSGAAGTGSPPQTVASEKRGFRDGAPWERRSDLGLWRSTFQTFHAVLFSPGDLFGGLAFEKGIGEPLAFGILLGSIGGMFSLFWQFLLASKGLMSVVPAEFGRYGAGLMFISVAALVPFFVALAIFIYSGVLHLLLMIVGGGSNGFEATFRVVSYSHAAQIWSVIPFVGGWIGGLWQLVVQVIGLQRIHQTSYWKVAIAFLIPVVFVIVLAAILIVPLLVYFF